MSQSRGRSTSLDTVVAAETPEGILLELRARRALSARLLRVSCSTGSIRLAVVLRAP